VTINELANAQNLTIDMGGNVTFGGNDTLRLSQNLTNNGTINGGSGTATLEASGSIAQSFSNLSATNVELNNLHLNNSNGLSMLGGWSISNSLQATLGTLDASGADSLVLVSNASNTAQILESAGTFVGDFTLQRYISSRNADFSNLSAPTSNATIASLYDDITMSGVGGPNGNIQANGGVFYSAYSFSRPYVKNRMTSLSDNLTAGVGYEIYLLSTVSSFDSTTIDYIGTPNFGNVTPPDIAEGFNLVGNPYYSHIITDNLDNSNIAAAYYIYNTDNGSYDVLGSGDIIAPGQGFWVDKIGAGLVPFHFDEGDKVSSNSSTFLRTKAQPKFTIELSNDINYFKNSMQVDFDYSATESIDQFDARFLPSPHKNSSALYSKSIFSDKLIKNTLNQLEDSHVIPLELQVGDAGTYTIESKNINTILKDYSCVFLNDKETNESIDLSLTSNYSFDAKPGVSIRFNLILSNSFEDCEAKLNAETMNQKLDSKINLRESYGSWFLDYKLGNINQLFKVNVYGLNGQQVIPSYEISLSENGSFQLSALNNLEGIFVIQIIGQKEVINKTVKL
jgi:hypothetical protein